MKCVICGNEITETVYSAYPFAEGVCCYKCYLTTVISAKEKDRYQRIAAVDKQMYEKRLNFVNSMTDKKARELMPSIVKSMVKSLFYMNEWGINSRVLSLLGVSLTEEERKYVDAPFYDSESEAFCKALVDSMIKDEETASRVLMFYAYALYYDAEDRTNWGAYGEDEFEVTEDTALMYELLDNLGYEKSAEEKMWYDGTHVVYAKPKEQEDED